MSVETPKIKLGEKLGFLTFSGSNNIVYQFKNLYYLFFLTNVVKVDIGWAGIILTIGMVWDAINDPLLGYWAVNRKFKNGEVLRPFVFWHTFPWAVTIVLLFTNFGFSQKVSAAVALVLYILFEVFNTTVSLPYNGMGGLATNRESDRRSINVFRNLGGSIGSGIGAVACLPLLQLFGALDSKGNLSATASRGFFIVACIMGTIMIIGSLIHFSTTKERVKQISKEDSSLSPARIIKMLVHCKSWMYNTLYIICYGTINLLIMANVVYYATYVLRSTAAATPIQAAFLAASIAASFMVGPIDKALGRSKTMMIGAVIAILGKVWFIIQPTHIGAMYVNAITLGISGTIAFVLFNTNRNNIVDIIESRSTRRIDSMVATTDNLASKMAVAGATLLCTMLLKYAGFDADLSTQPAEVVSVLNTMLGWAPALASAVMLVVAFFLPIEKEYAEARTKLADLKEKALNENKNS